MLSLFRFTNCTANYWYNMESCHLQKFSDDTAIVGIVVNGPEDEYRGLVDIFMKWCGENHLKLNMAKTKEMVVAGIL